MGESGFGCVCRVVRRSLTLEMVRGMLKSFPPCSLKPHGAGPVRVTVYEAIFTQNKRPSDVNTPATTLCLPVFPRSSCMSLSLSLSCCLSFCYSLPGGLSVGSVGELFWAIRRALLNLLLLTTGQLRHTSVGWPCVWIECGRVGQKGRVRCC